jgi:hypothetical protein
MKSLTKWYSELNIYYKLIPFLLLYLTICIAFYNNELWGDEGRYLMFANNLIRGFYSPQYPEIDLWNGPGYPILLAPFVFFKLPLLVIRLLNGFLLYFSLIISYKTFCYYSSARSSLIYTTILGFYFPIYTLIPSIYTECLTWFLISLVCYFFIKNYKQKFISTKLIILSGFSITYLAMTKIIFGYVIIIMLIVSICMFFWPRFRLSAKKSILIFSISLVLCLPWLIYTYQLTHKPLYWTNSGSMSLYTMSTPYENELGDWKTFAEMKKNPNHQVFIDSILKLKPLEIDEAFKSAALKNIKNNPKKYLSNWIANVGRLIFSYPYSNTEQKITSYFTIVPNMFIVVFIVLAFSISSIHWKKLPYEIILLTLFIVIYLLGSTLVSAYNRMFFITMPFWFLFLSCFFNNIVSVKIK